MSYRYLDSEFQDLRPEQIERINLEHTTPTPKITGKLLPPREYQYEIFKKAVSENTIAVLDTGAGKTLIAVMLIKHMLAIENEKLQSNKDYKKRVTFFLVDRVHLVFQQASVIRANCDARIKELCGDMNVDAWKMDEWADIWNNNDICVLTAQIFLNNLRRGFLSLDRVNLMIFDECHHASKGHPFNLIMIEFYHRIFDDPQNQASEKPKIFGMTASPIQTSSNKILESINTLETSLTSLVYTAKSSQELTTAVIKPFEIEVFYSMSVINDVPPPTAQQIKGIKVQERFPRSILTTLISNKIAEVPGYQQCINAIIYISNNLGPWCSDKLWKSILYKANQNGLFSPTLYTPACRLTTEQQQSLIEAYNMCTPNMCTPFQEPDIGNERLFTPKTVALIKCLEGILNDNPDKSKFCGIIFVDRRHTAVAIKILIEALTAFQEDIRCDVLIGHGTNTGGDLQMKYTKQNEVIAKFRSGELNLLIATNVAEEGLDIQACNFVIRFDLFKTVIAYIQSRGRARRKDSKFFLLLNKQNLKDVRLLDNVIAGEKQLKKYCRRLPKDRNLALKYEESPIDPLSYNPEYIKQALSEKYLRDALLIESTGALLTRSNAIALVYHYCVTLPSDIYYNSKPTFKFDDLTHDGFTFEEQEAFDLPPKNPGTTNNIWSCTLTLPINARIQQFIAYDRSRDDVKARVSLKACIALYKAGDINDHLLPKSKTQRQVLLELEEELDENGKQVGSRGREDFYEKSKPSFWKRDVEDRTELGPYYLSLIEVDPSMQTNNSSYRPMCLITKKPLPIIPEITLFNDDILFQVYIKSQCQRVLFNKQDQVDTLKDYTFAFLKCITNKDFTCPREDIEYLIAPLVASGNHGDPGKFDWPEIRKTVANINSPMSVDIKDEDSITDAIVIDSSDQKKRKYYVQSLQRNMTPKSVVPAVILSQEGVGKKLREYGSATFAEYYENLEFFSEKITDMTQPLLKVNRIQKGQSFLYKANSKYLKSKTNKEPESVVIWLVPEICQLYPISASVYQTLQIIPDVMTRIDATLLLYDARESLVLSNKMNHTLMLEAYTASSAGLGKDYQRLEFLGDSVLKFITSTYVFVSLPVSNEYELTESRTRMISNKALFESALQLHLSEYICSQNLPRRFWRPPNYACKDDSAEMTKSLKFHKLSDKTMADVIESTLGASYLSSFELQEALHTAKKLLVPLPKVDQWSDFQKVYIDQRNEHKLETAYNPKLDQQWIDVKKVSHILGYEFKNESLIAEALTHASVPYSSVPCYQRLEFLGDAVLDFCVTNYLFTKYNTAPPSLLHDLRKSSVNNDILSVLCIQLELNVHIRHFSTIFPSAVEQFQQLVLSSQQESGEYWLNFNPPKVLSDVIESLIGAVYVDAGFTLDPVVKMFNRLFKPLLDKHITLNTIQQHPLGKLKQMVQEFGCRQCEIRNVKTETGQHCVVFIHGLPFASGSGVNTKEARKQAATNAIQRILDYPDEFIEMSTC